MALDYSLSNSNPMGGNIGLDYHLQGYSPGPLSMTQMASQEMATPLRVDSSKASPEGLVGIKSPWETALGSASNFLQNRSQQNAQYAAGPLLPTLPSIGDIPGLGRSELASLRRHEEGILKDPRSAPGFAPWRRELQTEENIARNRMRDRIGGVSSQVAIARELERLDQSVANQVTAYLGQQQLAAQQSILTIAQEEARRKAEHDRLVAERQAAQQKAEIDRQIANQAIQQQQAQQRAASGNNLLGSAAAGAAIGSGILPGIGTAIGAAAGFFGDLFDFW